MPSHDSQLLLRVDEAAERIAMSRSRVYNMMQSGELPFINVGRSRRLRASDLEAWVDAQVKRTEGQA